MRQKISFFSPCIYFASFELFVFLQLDFGIELSSEHIIFQLTQESLGFSVTLLNRFYIQLECNQDKWPILQLIDLIGISRYTTKNYEDSNGCHQSEYIHCYLFAFVKFAYNASLYQLM
ncbi:hypothetical protein FGO68_gene1244 [Halteria grandinella]|uniref:Uncharacterized protein n=1 Tax=Halteria grandinella TaxID=5974 RepID=A0A8J8NGX7_HALGN|nr:hypothetical protein FGO68_gene1244 [Halteria grandinella]